MNFWMLSGTIVRFRKALSRGASPCSGVYWATMFENLATSPRFPRSVIDSWLRWRYRKTHPAIRRHRQPYQVSLGGELGLKQCTSLIAGLAGRRRGLLRTMDFG